jgi:hypothetical protein
MSFDICAENIIIIRLFTHLLPRLQSNDWGTHLNSRQNHSYLAALNYGQARPLSSPEFIIYGICCAALSTRTTRLGALIIPAFALLHAHNRCMSCRLRLQCLDHIFKALPELTSPHFLKHLLNSHPRSLLALSTHDFSDLTLRILILRRLFTTTA